MLTYGILSSRLKCEQNVVQNQGNTGTLNISFKYVRISQGKLCTDKIILDTKTVIYLYYKCQYSNTIPNLSGQKDKSKLLVNRCIINQMKGTSQNWNLEIKSHCSVMTMMKTTVRTIVHSETAGLLA